VPTKKAVVTEPSIYTDLRGITREADKVVTEVTLDIGKRTPWLVFGQANLRPVEHGRVWFLESYLKDDATDGEHDSAYALRLPLIGVTLDGIYYHTTRIEAWVYPGNFHDFRVPLPGYDPFKLEGSGTCKRCEPHHLMVPEGFYVPPFDQKLFEFARGLRVDISIGDVMPEDAIDE
jgi:hypothetical protein